MDIESDGKTVFIYPYVPNAGAAGLFIAVFGLTTLGHTFEMFRLRTAYFIPLIIGCIMETFGYYGRFWLHQDSNNFKAYVLEILLLLPAPIFMAATLYMALSRIIRSLDGATHALIRPRISTTLFVLADIFLFIIQMAGSGMQATTSAHIRDIGPTVVIIGLVVQIVVFCLFIACAWTFYVRQSNSINAPMIPWKRYLKALIAASFGVLLRNIVRIFEYAQGPRGFVKSHEAFVYVFDAVPMATAVVAFLILHPGRLARNAAKLRKVPSGNHEAGKIPKA